MKGLVELGQEIPQAGEETCGSVRCSGAGVTEGGAQPAPTGLPEEARCCSEVARARGNGGVFLMECLLRARRCARPVHSPAGSSLSTYCMPGSMQGARDSRVNKNSIPAPPEPAGGGPDGKTAPLLWLPRWLARCLQAVFELRPT